MPLCRPSWWATKYGPFLFSPESNNGGLSFPATGVFTVGKKLYCGNLSYNTSSSDLEQLFTEFGRVQSAEVIKIGRAHV